MYYKKLVGKKCYLSPIDLNDAEKFTEWLNDLEVTTNLGPLYSGIINVEGEKEILKDLSQKHNYSIIDIETNELIGNCGFLEIDNVNQIAEIGIFIGNKKFWGKGYGTEALVLLIDYGFKALNLHNILLKVFSFNERAMKCYEKVGFKIIGKRREALNRGDKKFDAIFMDILYDEFYKKK
ncbi:MAG: GNAT family N-acetyltransferase [Treponema sp.]|jgi:RimJ/RimL family protein N-acetyltransferase|nr:GNAT family N-acetyltransferase [Treponema sp.]